MRHHLRASSPLVRSVKADADTEADRAANTAPPRPEVLPPAKVEVATDAFAPVHSAPPSPAGAYAAEKLQPVTESRPGVARAPPPGFPAAVESWKVEAAAEMPRLPATKTAPPCGATTKWLVRAAFDCI